MEVDRNGLEVLDRDECLQLLSTATLGRIAFTSGALPSVLPVNFSLDGERILLRTREGSRLDAALQNAVVAFEVDDVDPDAQAGWSVAVTGQATEISDPIELEATQDEPRERWTTQRESLVAVSTELLSGRRIIAGSRPTRR